MGGTETLRCNGLKRLGTANTAAGGLSFDLIRSSDFAAHGEEASALADVEPAAKGSTGIDVPWVAYYDRGRPHSAPVQALPDPPTNPIMFSTTSRLRLDGFHSVYAKAGLGGLHHWI